MEEFNYPLELEYFDEENHGFIRVNLINIIGESGYVVEDNNKNLIKINDKSNLRVISFLKNNFEIGSIVQYKSNSKDGHLLWKEAKIEGINGEIISLLNNQYNEIIITRKKDIRIVKIHALEIFETLLTTEKTIDTERVRSILSSVDLFKEKTNLKFYFDIGEKYLRYFNYKPFVAEQHSLRESELINNILKTIIYNEELLSI